MDRNVNIIVQEESLERRIAELGKRVRKMTISIMRKYSEIRRTEEYRYK